MAGIMLSGCNKADEEELIAESKARLEKTVNHLNLQGPGETIDEDILNIYPHITANDYLGFMYYVLQTKRGITLNQLDQALLFADTAEHVYTDASPRLRRELRTEYLDFLIHKGNILFARKEYVVGYDTFFKILQLLKKHPYKDLENIVYHAMGMNAYKQKVYDKAAEYFKNELGSIDVTPGQYLPSNLRFFRRQQALSNIALCYNKLKILDSASLYYTSALNYVDNFHKGNCNIDQYNACRAVILGNLAKLYLLKNLPDSAIYYYNQSIYLTLYRPLQNPASGRDVKDAGSSLIQLADIYRSKGDMKNFRKTIKELNKWYDNDINYVFNHDEYRLGYLRQNASYYEDIGNSKKAYSFLQQYSNARDSIERLETISKEKNLSVAMEIKTHEEEVKTLTLSNKLIKTYTWSAAIIALLVTVVAVLFFRSGQKSKMNNLTLQTLNNEIKQQQKEAQYAFEQAVDANREKDRLLHVIAHDLRNPLSGISSLADIILERKNNVEVQQTVEAISKASKRSMTMVNELLDSAENQSVKLDFSKVSLNTLAEEVLESFKFRANEKKIELELKQSSTEVFVMGDTSKLMRVFSNLLHNAIKFSEGKKQVTIEVTDQQGKAIISIVDHGIGMSEKVLASLSDGFGSIVRNGTDSEKGFGIGWKSCQQIISAHNGNLIVTSKENFGSNVTIELEAIEP